jgi:cellulose synthase/poly-beta-1,6-N-acetylglucosamine synthase-like glycosyltransferase
VARLNPVIEFFAVAYIIGISLTVRASLARRIAMASHVVLFIGMSVLLEALMIVVGMTTHSPIAPYGIEAPMANICVGGLVIARMTFTTFVLPKGITLPARRPRWRWDTALTVCALVSALALLITGYAFLTDRRYLTSGWHTILALYLGRSLFVLLIVPLWLLWWARRRLPEPGEDRPPVDVIIPAYNEAENIDRLLRSIDVAAGRYRSPVYVVVSDDGSSDATAQISQQAIARFHHARGRVLTASNAGQAAALNRALAITDAEIVVRIDADCELGEDALKFAVPWFRDPLIGSVGAAQEPRKDTITWFHRMRTVESLFAFRFMRVGQNLVDAVPVIPGPFTAFRREPVAIAGGYAEGMNGEDGDLTMVVGRLGYRVVVDPRVRTYEDVPRSIGAFVEQRTRWARANVHVYARHVPFRSGFAGPRVWLYVLRRSFTWFSLQVAVLVPLFVLELVLTRPAFRHDVRNLVGLFVAGHAVAFAVTLPLIAKHRAWRALAWQPTYFAYAFLWRLGVLEARISLPTRPFLARIPSSEPQLGPERAPSSTVGRHPHGPFAPV